jgi:FAD/FMN-containing dehydrogenase
VACHDAPVPSWSNWAGNVTCRPRQAARPATVAEVQRRVAETALPVRVAGAGHSFAPLCATDGLLLELSALTGVLSVDAARGTATVAAGTRIADLGEPLRAAGVGLANQGDVDTQAIAGAVATGTHGSGDFGSLATIVRSADVVLPSGDLVRQPGEVAALALGLLGVIVSLELAVLPAYRLHERTWHCAYDEAEQQWAAAADGARNLEFFWLPVLDRCVFKRSAASTDEPWGDPPPPPQPPGTIERYLKPERVDWSHRIYPSERGTRFVETEYAVPAATAFATLSAVRDLMQTQHPELTWAVEFRGQAGDALPLSPTQGRDVVTISLHAVPDDAWQPGFAAAERLLVEAGGRPHWGKLRGIDDEQLAALYPRIEEFRARRREADPAGRLLNDYLRPLCL